MKKIAVVVDSTAVIDKKTLAEHCNLYSIPLQLIIGHDTYRDGIDLSQQEFFSKVDEGNVLPTTSQPPVGEVTMLFEELLQRYEHIIYITISTKLSGTYQSGILASQQVIAERITVYDSGFTATIQKQMAFEALELIAKGEGVAAIIAHLDKIKANSEIVLVVDDLKHLHRTGRIGLASASVGSMLKIKPLLEFVDGEIVLKQKVRTIKRAHGALLELIAAKQLSEQSKIIIAHANGQDYANKLKESFAEIYPHHEIAIDELSPVISVHTGPKTLGLSWIRK